MSNKKRISKKRDQLRKRYRPHLIFDIETFCDFGNGDVTVIACAYVDSNGVMLAYTCKDLNDLK